jgi:hypothetical protein
MAMMTPETIMACNVHLTLAIRPNGKRTNTDDLQVVKGTTDWGETEQRELLEDRAESGMRGATPGLR